MSHSMRAKHLLAVLLIFGAFEVNEPQTLQTIVDKELVTRAIEIDVFSAEQKV